MKWLKTAGLVWLTALTLTASGKKALAERLQDNKENIIETLQATPEKKADKEANYVAKASEFKEDSLSVTKALTDMADLWWELSKYYTEEWLNTKIQEIYKKHPHFETLSYEEKAKVLKEYFWDYIKESNRNWIFIWVMILTIMFLVIHHHFTTHKKPRDPSLF